MTPKQFAAYRATALAQIETLKSDLAIYQSQAEKAPTPLGLRLATGADIKPGVVVWYPFTIVNGFAIWRIVESAVIEDGIIGRFIATDDTSCSVVGTFVET